MTPAAKALGAPLKPYFRLSGLGCSPRPACQLGEAVSFFDCLIVNDRWVPPLKPSFACHGVPSGPEWDQEHSPNDSLSRSRRFPMDVTTLHFPAERTRISYFTAVPSGDVCGSSVKRAAREIRRSYVLNGRSTGEARMSCAPATAQRSRFYQFSHRLLRAPAFLHLCPPST